jgi:hypothetical protein
MILVATLLVASATPPEPIIHDLAFTGPNGWTYDARLLEPAGKRSGLTVLMIGGGIGNDLDWTVPGTLEWNGSSTQMTIDGTTHHDAPRIARSLTAHGHAVMHYSTIAHEDPKRDGWPFEITLMTPADLLLLAQAAARVTSERPETRTDHLVLLAHSMGAQRACAQAAEDPHVKALVLIGAAQMTRTGPDDPGRNLQRTSAAERLGALDLDQDGLVQGEEIPDTLDFDGDGILRAWELSASMAMKARDSIQGKLPDKNGMPFGEDSLQTRPLPTLVLYGNLDEAQAYHAPILQSLATSGVLPNLKVRILPGIGHQLGPEQDGRLGPISDTALNATATFINAQIINTVDD